MTKTNITSIGLDLSLSGTGVVILKNGEIVLEKLIKSKPIPEGKPVDEVKRIQKIVEDIEYCLSDELPDIAVIEGLAFMVKNATALVQLSALNYMTRALLLSYNIPFIIAAPTSLKKFITGNGASKKDVMLIETFKRYGVTILDDNECDAYGLARIGEALVSKKQPELSFQQEVLATLKKQL